MKRIPPNKGPACGMCTKRNVERFHPDGRKGAMWLCYECMHRLTSIVVATAEVIEHEARSKAKRKKREK